MNKQQPNQSRHEAFTLIELLVVISIVALLISILLPALGKARKTSRAIVCQSTIKQIGIWATTYAVDNKGILPTHGDTSWSATWINLSSTHWASKAISAGLYNGWGNDSVIKCPEALIQISPLRNPNWNFTYGINQYMGGIRQYSGHPDAPLPRLEVLNSRGFWFGESRAVWYTAQQYWDFHPVLSLSNSSTPSSSWPWSWSNTVAITTGHPEQNTSFLYGDGHAGFVSKGMFQNEMSSNQRLQFIMQHY